MSQIIPWLRLHAGAILASGVCVAKAGVLSKSASAFIFALAAAMGG